MKKQTLAMIAILFGAIGSNAQNGESKQQVHVIHHVGHEIQHFDTIYSKSSGYNVEQYLRDKGFEPTDVEIINVEGGPDQGVWVMGSDFKQEFTWNTTIDNSKSGKHIFVKKDGGAAPPHKVRIVQSDKDEEVFEIELDELDEMQEFDWKSMVNTSDTGTTMDVKVVTVINDDGDEENRMWINGEEVDPESAEGYLLFEEKSGTIADFMMDQPDEKDGNSKVRREVIVIERDTEEGPNDERIEKFIQSASTSFREPLTIALVSDIPDDIQPLGVSEHELSIENLQFFPNPNEGKFNLQFELPQSGETQIEIFNTSGQRVYSENLGTFSGEFRRDIDISEQPAGTYILHITQAGKHLAEKVIVK